MTAECKDNMAFNLDDVATLPIEEAWDQLVKTAKEAVETRDLDDFRTVRSIFISRFQASAPSVSLTVVPRQLRCTRRPWVMSVTTSSSGRSVPTTSGSTSSQLLVAL